MLRRAKNKLLNSLVLRKEASKLAWFQKIILFLSVMKGDGDVFFGIS